MFGGGSSFQLARVLGIRIGVNASWFIVLFLFIYLYQPNFRDALGASDSVGFAVAVAAAVLFFGSILLHELGHAVAARREGIEVTGIELFLFGGVMKMSQDTTSPGAEFRVAAAGPLVTLGLVLVSALLMALIAGPDRIFDDTSLSGNAVEDIPTLLISLLLLLNAALLVFNLVPAFPLDGGRIARAAAWKVTGDRGRATRFSARLGQGFAVLLIAYGLYQVLGGDSWGLWCGHARLAARLRRPLGDVQSAFTDQLEGITVADLMDAEPVTIPADLPAAQAYDDFFLRYQGWEWFAVVEPDGRFIGLAHRGRCASCPRAGRATARCASWSCCLGDEGQVQADTPLEALLGSEPLRRLGALMAVDREGRLRGVVTLEQVTGRSRPTSPQAETRILGVDPRVYLLASWLQLRQWPEQPSSAVPRPNSRSLAA